MNALIALLMVLPVLATIVGLVLGSRHRAAWPSFRIPPAEETAASVTRFRDTAERFIMLDMAWEKFSQGRALLVDDMRSTASRGPRRRLKEPIPRWI